MKTGFYCSSRRGTRRPASAVALALTLAACMLCWPASGRAQSMLMAWERARDNEPALQSTRASLTAAEERAVQALAALRPQVSFTLNANANRRDYVQGPPVSNETRERFRANSEQLTLTQPLWRGANRIARVQALQTQQQAGFQVFATEQDLATRFVTAWFEAMAARDAIRFTNEQALATRQQATIVERGMALGSYSEVQRDDARAKAAQAQADHAAAVADYPAKVAALEQLTGALPAFAPPSLDTADEALFAPAAEPLSSWLARIENQSPAVLAATKALDAAREEVRKQQAQHEPTVDLVANMARNVQGAGGIPSQAPYTNRQDSLGIQVSVPLYTGGAQSSKVREAVALAGKAEFDLDTARRAAIFQASQAWAGLQTAHARRAAGDASAMAAASALKAATTGQATGLKIYLDELQARQQLAAARKDKARASYDGLIAASKLRAAVGELDMPFMARIQQSLAEDKDPAPARN